MGPFERPTLNSGMAVQTATLHYYLTCLLKNDVNRFSDPRTQLISNAAQPQLLDRIERFTHQQFQISVLLCTSKPAFENVSTERRRPCTVLQNMLQTTSFQVTSSYTEHFKMIIMAIGLGSVAG